MKAMIVSDLHLEFWKERSPINLFKQSNKSKPDVVILAGDICSGANAVRWASEFFSGIKVLYVMGNHEAYGSSIEQTELRIAAECDRSENVTFLNCDEFIFQNVRFLGCTLWTDFKLFGEDQRLEAMRESALYISDYNAIRIKAETEADTERKLSTIDTAYIFEKHSSWLQSQLDQRFDGKTVVVTHMSPSFLSVHDRFKKSLASAAFSSNLENLVVKSDLWIHGHTHDSYNYKIGDCMVICNPCGYPMRSGSSENGAFDPNLFIEIES